MKITHIIGALAAVLLAAPSLALAQQNIPAANGAGGQIFQGVPAVPCIAPSGGGNGICTPVAPDQPLPTTGAASVVSANLTRPANTTTYTANTGLANATSGATYLTFSNVCRAAGKVVLVPHLTVIDFANQTTKLSGMIVFFKEPPGTIISDNAAFNLASADIANKVLTVPFTVSTVLNSGAGASGIVEAQLVGTNYEANCGSSANLYAMVEVTNAYVPVSAEQFTFTIKTVAAN